LLDDCGSPASANIAISDGSVIGSKAEQEGLLIQLYSFGEQGVEVMAEAIFAPPVHDVAAGTLVAQGLLGQLKGS
jgi:hypothetical protein